MTKSKHFTSDNLIKILGCISLFFILKTYNRIDVISDKIIENDRRVWVLETKVDYLETSNYIGIKE